GVRSIALREYSSPVRLSLLLHSHGHHPHLHSFPTRRSSDLVSVTFQTFDDYVNDSTGIIEALVDLAHNYAVLDESVVSEVEYEVITGMVDQYLADVHENLDDWEDEFREVNEDENAESLDSIVEN